MGRMCFSEVGFIAFIAKVVHCTAEMDGKSQKIEDCGGSGREVLVIERIYLRTAEGVLSGGVMLVWRRVR
jgi:hypothetical protein